MKAQLQIHIWKLRFTGQVHSSWVATPNADMAEVREVLGYWEDHKEGFYLQEFELVSAGRCGAAVMLAAAHVRLAEAEQEESA